MSVHHITQYRKYGVAEGFRSNQGSWSNHKNYAMQCLDDDDVDMHGNEKPEGYFGPLGWMHPESQGVVIKETGGFPNSYDDTAVEYFSAYTDRLRSWDSSHFEALIKFVGTGDQGWATKVPNMNEKTFKEFIMLLFKKDVMPSHARMVYWFNSSNGYDCPSFEATFPNII